MTGGSEGICEVALCLTTGETGEPEGPILGELSGVFGSNTESSIVNNAAGKVGESIGASERRTRTDPAALRGDLDASSRGFRTGFPDFGGCSS